MGLLNALMPMPSELQVALDILQDGSSDEDTLAWALLQFEAAFPLGMEARVIPVRHELLSRSRSRKWSKSQTKTWSRCRESEWSKSVSGSWSFSGRRARNRSCRRIRQRRLRGRQ